MSCGGDGEQALNSHLTCGICDTRSALMLATFSFPPNTEGRFPTITGK